MPEEAGSAASPRAPPLPAGCASAPGASPPWVGTQVGVGAAGTTPLIPLAGWPSLGQAPPVSSSGGQPWKNRPTARQRPGCSALRLPRGSEWVLPQGLKLTQWFLEAGDVTGTSQVPSAVGESDERLSRALRPEALWGLTRSSGPHRPATERRLR